MDTKYLTLVSLFLTVVCCQAYYIPAQVFVPAIPYYGWNNSYNSSYNNPRYDNYNNNSGWRNESWNEPGHIFLGRIGPLDKLLFTQLYYKDSRWWSSREKIIEYPNDVNSGYVRHETISAIHIINKFYQGNHANASILSGGVGKQYVKIRLASTWGYGLRFLVQIFGH
ncbi:hypothetical protein HHI36_019271 [Cryptolaemus montrouzieri]|uniref:Uncharacterized protein n=1 Tax=Cryptolaemus montrouzieri TaxID=559131 RepID=A0ABD2P2Y9_9CUCU